MRGVWLAVVLAALAAPGCGRLGYERIGDADAADVGADAAVGADADVDAGTGIDDESCGVAPTTCSFPNIVTLSPSSERFLSTSTRNQGDFVSGSCVAQDFAEYRVLARADEGGTFRITTEGSSIDAVLYVLDGGCDGPELACNDGAGGSQPIVTVALAAGQQILIVADGKSPVCGVAQIHITAI